MKTVRINLIVLMILSLVSLSTFAQQGSPQGNQARGSQEEVGMKKGKDERGMMIPNMTEEQKESMKAIKTSTGKKMLPLKSALGEKEAKLKTLQTAEKVDMKAIDSQIDDIGKLKTDMAKIKSRSMQDIRALLTDEQRVDFDSRLLEGGKKGEKRGGKPGRGAGK